MSTFITLSNQSANIKLMFYIDVYGAQLPFTVKIAEPEYEVFAINQD